MRDSQDAEAVFLVSGKKLEPMSGERRTELLAVETVVGRMGDQMTKNEVGVKGRVNLFKVEEPPLNKNPSDFADPFFPVLQMMDDAEVKDRIRTGIRVGKVLGVGHKEKGEPGRVAMEPFLPEFDHGGVDIDGIHATGMKSVVNKFYALAPAASDLKTKRAGWKRPDLPEKADLSSLDPGAYRAVDPDSFRPVDPHTFESSPP